MARTSPLAKAMRGDKVTDRQAQGALSQAVDKIASLTKRAQKSKEAMATTGAMVVHTAEMQGSLFLSSMAEGYFGSEKLKIGSVDLRAPIGLLAQGYGLYEAMSGKGGGHALALGNGVMGSWLASVGRQAGQALAEKRAVGGQTALPGATPQAAQPPVVTPAVHGMPLLPEPMVQGPMREVLLTPAPAPAPAPLPAGGVHEGEEDEEVSGRRRAPRGRRRRSGGRRGRPGRRRPNRFVRPPIDDDDDLDEDDA